MAWSLLLALAAAGQSVAPPPILDYVRANPDGSEAERVLVYLPAPDRVEVAKMRDRCTSAAWVTGEVDRATGGTVRLEAGRLMPGPTRQIVGALEPAAGAPGVTLSIDHDGATIRETTTLAPGPWHDYDFDLASLGAVLGGAPPPAGPIRFAMPMVWTGDGAHLVDLGMVTLVREGEETYAGRAAVRYRATGNSPRFEGGPIWLDRARGYVLGAHWGTPNHAEYTAFRLDLTATHPGGSAAWTRLLDAHWRNCPSVE